MKRLLVSTVRLLLPVGLVLAVNRFLRAAAAAGHKLQYLLQWRIAKRTPAWFDHSIDQYWKWHASRDPSSWQRGILGLLAMRPGCRVLDLCCGDGFYTYYFYSGRAGHVVAADYDRDGIRHAKIHNAAPNIEYRCADIRTAMPQGQFENICWDAGIEYFTLPETEDLMAAIKSRLTPSGILSGCGIVAEKDGRSHIDHKHEFPSPDELARFLRRFFTNVLVINTQPAGRLAKRRTFHFFAADGALPFDPHEENFIRLSEHIA